MNWQRKKLGEVIKLEYGKPLPKSQRKRNGLYPVYGANGEIDRSNKYYYSKKSIIVGRKGSAGELNLTEEKFWPLDVSYYVTFDDKLYDLKFIFNLLTTLELPKLAKGVKPGINRNEVYAFDVKIPPLPEQQRLVAILDKVFTAIATAKENTEKNLRNTRELFESYLQSIFANSCKGWEKKNFEETIEKVTYTNKIQRKEFLESGKFPVVSQEKDLINGYWNDRNDIFKIKKPVIIFGDHTQILKYIDFDFVLGADGVKILQPKDFLFPKFFYYLLKSINLKSLGYARHYRLFKEKQVLFPKSLPEQQCIVTKLDALSTETKKLEGIYQQKLSDLDELKKSILQKAFDGEL